MCLSWLFLWSIYVMGEGEGGRGRDGETELEKGKIMAEKKGK